MRSRLGIVPGVRKIAVLRANGIGDLMFALPALAALRQAYPRAELVLLASEWHQAFLENRPGPIDRVVAVPPSRGVREEPGCVENGADTEAFFERMRDERFDLAIQMHGGGRYSNPFLLGLGAALTIGFRTPDAVPLDRWIPYIYFQSEVIRYLELASIVGARPDTLDPRVEVTARDLAESRAVVPEGGRPFVVLHPSASDPRRRWPAEKFGRAGANLRAAGLDVFVIGIDRDRDLARAVVDGMHAEAASDLTGQLSLGGAAGLLSRAAVVISNDSGPLHLAAAVGTPTVGIYWCGNVITAAPVTRARHRPMISWRLDCPRCGANAIEDACAHRDSFVADVGVDDVTMSALELLEEEGEPARPRQGGLERVERELQEVREAE